MSRPALGIVDPETGEVSPANCPSCAKLQDQLRGAERDIRAWRARCAELERDSERKARDHPAWQEIRETHDYWRRHCRHPRSKFTAERFWLALPLHESEGTDLCRRAIDGAAFDPFTKPRRNGSTKRFDDWELIFKSRAKFEEFVNRAPRNERNAA